MKNYYILDFLVANTDYFAERVTISNPEIEDLIFEGTPLTDKKFNIILKKHPGTVRNIIEHIYGFPIVSQTVADVLSEHCAGEIELFEVEVERKINQKYYFVNILNVLDDCIDVEQSVFELFKPDVLIFKSLDKLVLDTHKIHHNIFRIKSLRTEIVISEKLKQKLEALDMEEFYFKPTEAYTE